MPLKKRVVCLGILVADIVARPLSAMPDRGRLVLVPEMALHTGGCALNTATGLARLGVPVDVIGRIGMDPLGDFLWREMERRGIGVRGVVRDGSAGTSATMVMVEPDGERRFIHYIGASAHLTLDDVDVALFQGASLFQVAGALVLPGLDGEPMAGLLQKARSAGLVTFLDVVWDDTGRWLALLDPCLPYVDFFAPSLAEAQAATGLEEPEEVASALLARGVQAVVLKMGAAGCLVTARTGEFLRVPAFDVEVIDSTGAGDAFNAGFITGLLMGWPLEQVARFANAVGALCVTGLGAAGNVQPLTETLAFMESAKTRRS